MRRLLVALCAVLLFPATAGATVRAHADGLGACSSGAAPYGYHGSCGTFNNANTWYGTHGPGFPTPLGWGICAVPAAHGGYYPAPGYRYAPTTAPAGAATSSLAALGWAFSETQRRGWWANGNGATFSRDDLGVAAKLLYDNLAWGNKLPSTPASVMRALTALSTLLTTGRTITATPALTLSLQGGGTTIATTGVAVVSVVVPGTNAPLAGAVVTLTSTQATFDATGGTTTVVTTNANGQATAPFTTSSGDPSSVTLAGSVGLAVPGVLFYGPTTIALNAQVLVTPRAPVTVTSRLQLTSTGTPRGTVTVTKSVDDPAYLPANDAVFSLLDGSDNVVATFVTGDDGTSGVSDPLPVGTYLLREVSPPTGYAAAADHVVTVVANTLTTVAVGPSEGDTALRGSLTLTKSDVDTAQALAGATFSLAYDTTHSGVADGTTATCVTDEAGSCSWSNLLPGWYLLSEVSPPPNYEARGGPWWVEIGPNAAVTMNVPNDPVMVTLAARKFNSLTDVAIPHATYDLYVAEPALFVPHATVPLDAAGFVGYRWFERGVTDANGALSFRVRAGYQWCLHEVAAPAGYVIDPALHCSTVPASSARTTVALPEVHSSIVLSVHKFNADNPNAGVPNATYALFVMGAFPAGFTPPATPDGLTVPPNGTLWAIDTTNALGQLHFAVPSGAQWCVQELAAPSDYELDPALHCTPSAVTASSPSDVTTLAIPETLAFTGSASWLAPLGVALLVMGGLLARRRRTS